MATRALNVGGLTSADKAKALYRRAQGRVLTKNDEEAEKDLRAAAELVAGDAGVSKLLREVEQRRKERKEKEKKAYAKMFG